MSSPVDLLPNDFTLTSRWKEAGRVCPSCNRFRFLRDAETKRYYLNDGSTALRLHHLNLICITPIVHVIPAILNIAYRIFRLLGCFDSRRVALVHAARIVLTPFTLVGLELAAIYGLFRPYDGRKLYATLERAEYGRSIAAPAFQPICH